MMRMFKPEPSFPFLLLLILGANALSAELQPRINLESPEATALASPLPPAVANPASTPQVLDWSQFDGTAIVRTYRGTQVFICSAVLIKKDLALTTAHCVENSEKNELLIGVSITDPKMKAYAVKAGGIRVHPDYQPKKSLFAADLALLSLADEVPVKSFIAVPSSQEVHLLNKQALERVGFGLRNGQNVRTWTQVFFTEQKAHTLYLNDSLSVTGDSGSAIFLRDKENLKLLGLHTTLLDPGKVAAVFLPDYRDWIYSTVKSKK